MRRTLEAIFRHLFQILTLMVLFPLVGVAVTYVMVPKTFQAKASLWAFHRYEVIGSNGVVESDLTATPAQTQATALTELLQTRTFALSVAQGVNNFAISLHLSSSVVNDPQQLQDALYNEISGHVFVTASAYNLFQLTYINRDPQVAEQVIVSVIHNYGTQSPGLSVVDGQNLLANYQGQLQSAKQAEDAAVNAEAQYLAQHPDVASSPVKQASDPQYQQLETARSQAQMNVQSIQSKINDLQQSINTTGGSGNVNTLFQVIDAPQVPQLAQSRSKNYLTGGGIGLGVALLADILFLVILVRRDSAIYSTHDLQDVVAIPVIMQLPRLTVASVSSLATSPIRE